MATRLVPVYRGDALIAMQEVELTSPTITIYEHVRVKATEPTRNDYIALLKSHDWDYDRADDSRVWRAGCNQRQILNSLQQRLDPDYAIWNEHCHANHRRNVLVGASA